MSCARTASGDASRKPASAAKVVSIVRMRSDPARWVEPVHSHPAAIQPTFPGWTAGPPAAGGKIAQFAGSEKGRAALAGAKIPDRRFEGADAADVPAFRHARGRTSP